MRSGIDRVIGGAVGNLIRIQPGRPAVMLGVRTALATAIPLLVAPHIAPWAATWASTAGFMVALADKGGSYRTRALTLCAVTLGVAASVWAGGVLSAYALPAIAFMVVWTAFWAFVRVLGPTASGAISSAIAYCLAVAVPQTSADAAANALAALAGGAWAMGLALLLWSVRVYRPGRLAVARCYDALAAQAIRIAQASEAQPLEAGHAVIRTAIEDARRVLAASRRGRQGESGRGALLLVLLQLADLLFGSLMALEVEGPAAPHIEGLARAFEDVADAIEQESRTELRSLHIAGDGPVYDRLRENLQIALQNAARLHDARPSTETVFAEPGPDMPGVWQRFAEQLTPRSVMLRHALRVGVAAGIAMVVAEAAGVQRGYWITLTVLVLLEPYTPATLEKSLQRLLGTVLGGIFVALVLLAIGAHPIALWCLAMVLAGTSAAVLHLNYALYSFLLTPTFVLLAEASAIDLHLPVLRIVNTLVGGVLALACSRILWPHHEDRLFPTEAADAIGCLRGYFDELARVVADDIPPPAPRLLDARRRFGLEISEADASFQRMLAELSTRGAELEPAMTMLLFARRCGASIGSIAAARTREESGAALQMIAKTVDTTLRDLEASVRFGRAPNAIVVVEVPDHPRVARLWKQLGVLHTAVERWATTSRSPAPFRRATSR